MLAGQQRELGIEANVVHSAIAELDPMLTQEVDQSQLDLQQGNLQPDAVVRPRAEWQIRHGHLAGLVLGIEALRIEHFRFGPILQMKREREREGS